MQLLSSSYNHHTLRTNPHENICEGITHLHYMEVP